MNKSFTEISWQIFNRSIEDYHRFDSVDKAIENPYGEKSIEAVLYHKNWIDTVQWHLEDIIRDPNIDPAKALEIKRIIDASNQERTDMVEEIDTWFRERYTHISPVKGAKINTESPAWAIDRLSILALKVYHMQEETKREDVRPEHRANCVSKLAVLREQHKDLSTAIEELLADIATGKKYMKVYRQMKMYNDPELNPVLYNREK